MTNGGEPMGYAPQLRGRRLLGRLRSPWRRLLLAFAFGTWLTGSGSAQVVSLRIADPVPAELQERVSQLLKLQRPHDTDLAIAATKIEDGGLWRNAKVLLLRVETGCRRGLCMVIVGRVTEQAIVPELILSTGPRVYGGDEVEAIWGARNVPLMFEGRDRSGLVAVQGEEGWVVEVCADCFPAVDGSHEDPDPIPSPVVPAPPVKLREETFDDFTRALGALR